MRLNKRLKKFKIVLLVAGVGALSTACAPNKFATLSSACDAFPQPAYQIKGASSYDQIWADETIETGVAGCGWHRPLKRPAGFDAATVVKTPAQPATIGAPSEPPSVTVQPKASWSSRLKAKYQSIKEGAKAKLHLAPKE